jgi:hypothetical protein
MHGGILAAVLFRQRGQVGGRDLQSRLCGTVAGGIGSVTDSTIAGKHFLAGSCIRCLDRHMLKLRRSRLLCHGKCSRQQQDGAHSKQLACVHNLLLETALR